MSILGSEYRYRNTLILAHAAWWSSLGLVLLRAFDVIPQQLGSIALLTVGIGVASSLSVARHRQTESLVKVFQAGAASAASISANAVTDTCVAVLDEDGVVISANRADAIGWTNEDLVGRDIRSIFEARSHGPRTIAPGSTISVPIRNMKGELFDAKVSIASMGGKQYPLTVALLAPTVKGTIS
ncbi:hypothetical protein ACFY7C_19775 [Streptomyces sp. NPDC012769]|uniref:hypothetical protein n=1 Tax=Streptomyces sp. NPDC012769 TaxID=3364848 RepID=UPI0036A5ED08